MRYGGVCELWWMMYHCSRLRPLEVLAEQDLRYARVGKWTKLAAGHSEKDYGASRVASDAAPFKHSGNEMHVMIRARVVVFSINADDDVLREQAGRTDIRKG